MDDKTIAEVNSRIRYLQHQKHVRHVQNMHDEIEYLGLPKDLITCITPGSSIPYLELEKIMKNRLK